MQTQTQEEIMQAKNIDLVINYLLLNNKRNLYIIRDMHHSFICYDTIALKDMALWNIRYSDKFHLKTKLMLALSPDNLAFLISENVPVKYNVSFCPLFIKNEQSKIITLFKNERMQKVAVMQNDIIQLLINICTDLEGRMLDFYIAGVEFLHNQHSNTVQIELAEYDDKLASSIRAELNYYVGKQIKPTFFNVLNQV